MNKHGNPRSLVPAHPGNLNAVRQGVHSPRLIQIRAAEIAAELGDAAAFSAAERLAVREAAHCIAILEAIDRDLDERGLVDQAGEPRYLLNHRARISRQLEQWLAKITAAIERHSAREQPPPQGEFDDYVQALQQIALGLDATATARDRLAALKELLKLGLRGRTSYLDLDEEPELARRSQAVQVAKRKRELRMQERDLGLETGD